MLMAASGRMARKGLHVCGRTRTTGSSCPSSDSLILCARDVGEVICGNVGCIYGSQCIATGAGWSPEYDEPACPMSKNVLCIEIFAPVECGLNLCQYSNQCVATAAGYKEGDCERVPIKEDPLDEESAVSSAQSCHSLQR